MRHLAPHFFARLSARVASLEADGRDIIRLDEGAPDLPPAAHILAALAASANRDDTHSYQPHRGPRALRQAWAAHYARRYGVALDPETEIQPLLGSKEGIFHLSQAFVGPGDLVIVPDPGYVTYTRGALFAGGETWRMPLLPERGYLPDLVAIPAEVLQRAKLMWLNYPNNPTGATAEQEFFAQAVELARANDILLCHDAAYMEVYFDGYRPASLMQAPGAKDVAVEFNTLSKSHNMAGWRSGALVGNPAVVKALFVLKTNADSSHFRPVFDASTAALDGDQAWLDERNAIYQARRDVVLAALPGMGMPAARPKASLYVWAQIPAGWSSETFVERALEECGVSLTPGTVFGPGGEGFVRISITAPLERVRQAMERLGDWVGRP